MVNYLQVLIARKLKELPIKRQFDLVLSPSSLRLDNRCMRSASSTWILVTSGNPFNYNDLDPWRRLLPILGMRSAQDHSVNFFSIP